MSQRSVKKSNSITMKGQTIKLSIEEVYTEEKRKETDKAIVTNSKKQEIASASVSGEPSESKEESSSNS